MIWSKLTRRIYNSPLPELKSLRHPCAVSRRFCQATGYGGIVQRRESVEEKIARHSRDNTITTRVKPGESALAFYTAENKSSTSIMGISTYNVTPMKAAVYFNKIQCFCFEEQRLLPGEQIDMPVFFYIDPEFETDPRMAGINKHNIIVYFLQGVRRIGEYIHLF